MNSKLRKENIVVYLNSINSTLQHVHNCEQ